jgi:hypothetical protein
VVALGKESYVRRPDFGSIEPMAPQGGLRASFEVGFLRLAWSREAPAGFSYWIAINLEMLALLLTVPTVLALVIHAACRRVLVRRCARGACPSCRYQVRMTSA